MRWFIPRIFQSAYTGKVHHKEELEKMRPCWKNVRVPVYYLQCGDDYIVNTPDAGFEREHLINFPSLEIKFLKGRNYLFARISGRISKKLFPIFMKRRKMDDTL